MLLSGEKCHKNLAKVHTFLHCAPQIKPSDGIRSGEFRGMVVGVYYPTYEYKHIKTTTTKTHKIFLISLNITLYASSVGGLHRNNLILDG